MMSTVRFGGVSEDRQISCYDWMDAVLQIWSEWVVCRWLLSLMIWFAVEWCYQPALKQVYTHARTHQGWRNHWGTEARASTSFGLMSRTMEQLCLYCLNCTNLVSVDSWGDHWNCCHQISNFMAKMHQIQFWLGVRSAHTPLEYIQHSPRQSSWIWGDINLLLRWREGKGEKGREERAGKEERGIEVSRGGGKWRGRGRVPHHF